MKDPLLAIPFTSVLMLAACGGNSTGGDVSPPPPAPTVSVSALASAIIDATFKVTWSSTNATSCTSNFGGGTGQSGSVDVTETSAGTKTYTVTCTGQGGSVTGSATTSVRELASAEGFWQGSTATSQRTISGVVTKDGKYWLKYSQANNAAVPRGFFAGSGTSTETDVTDGTFSATPSDLREYNFEGVGTSKGTVDGTFKTKTTFGGNLRQVSSTTVYNITGQETGTTNSAATLVISAANAPWIPQTIAAAQAAQTTNAITGSLDIPVSGTTINSGSLNVAAGGLYTFLGDFFGTTMNTSAATITFRSDLSGGWASTGSVVAGSCSGPGANAICPSAYNGSAALDYTLTPVSSTSWNLTLRLGTADPLVIGGLTTQHYALTGVLSALPSINDDTFTSTYNTIYETAPSLATIAKTYATGSAGIGVAIQTSSLTITSAGAITNGSAGACSFSGNIAPHSSGNLYDVTGLTFAGASCTYSSAGAFSGVATYDTNTQQITITAVDTTRDKGFLFVGTP